MKISKLSRLAAAGMLVAFMSAILLFGGVGITAYAAQDALPGDALYSVKTGMEQSRVALTRQSIEKARLNILYADRRLEEMLQLVELERYQDLETAVADFQAYTAQAVETLGTVSIASDPTGAKELTAVVAGILTRQSLAMNQLAASLPETARPVLQDALAAVSDTTLPVSATNSQSSNGLEYTGTVEQIAANSWVIDGVSYAVDNMTMMEDTIQVGDPVEFYVFTASDGTQTLWKVELASSSDGMSSSQDDMDDDGMEENSDDDSDDIMEMEEEDSQDDQDGMGMVEAFTDSSVTIDGVTYMIDPSTKMEGMFQVGDWVEFDTYTTADGSLALESVELKSSDDHSDDSLDDMGDDSNDDNYQNGSMYSEDDQEDSYQGNSPSGSSAPYYDSQSDDHEDDHSGQYYEDDHEDDDSQYSGSGDHSDDHDNGDHEEQDDHDD